MQWIDTHSHIYLDQFDVDREEVVKECREKGFEKIYLPNIDRSSVEAVHALADAHPDMCIPMMGLHPCSVKEDFQEELDDLKKLFDERSYAAVGEIGIDLYWDKSTLSAQQDAFRQQIRWAKDMGLPIVIHARESFAEIFQIVDEENDERLRGIFHCFTGGLQEANHILGYGGFKLGIGGVLTYKNAGLDKTLADVSLDHIVLETDAPYLSPIPFRGKRNSSAYLIYVAERLAQVKDESMQNIAAITTANAKDIFGS